MPPLTFTLPGFPRRFLNLDTMGMFLEGTINGPTDGSTYRITGIDYSAPNLAQAIECSYVLDGITEVFVGSDSTPVGAWPDRSLQFRLEGDRTIRVGESMTVILRSLAPAHITFAVWGLVVPVPYG